MKWIEISKPPKNSKDVLLWEGPFGRHDGMLRAFYNQKSPFVGTSIVRRWYYYTVTGKCKEIPDEVLKKYSHWLDVQPPVFERTIDLSGYKSKHKKGFINSEIKFLLKEFGVKSREFNKAIGVVTCQVIKGDTVYYLHDVETAIRCCLEKRSINVNKFD